MRGFVVDVGGVRFLNAQLTKLPGSTVSGYLILRYQTGIPDTLVIAPLEGDAEADDVHSARDLFEYLRAHAQDSTLYGRSTQFKRVGLWAGQPNNRLNTTVRPVGAPCWCFDVPHLPVGQQARRAPVTACGLAVR